MATNTWHGDAIAVAQIATGVITGNDAATTYAITIGGISVSNTGQATANLTAADLFGLAAASTDPRFTAVTWTNPSGANIVATATVAGPPLGAVLSATGGGGTVTDFVDDTPHAGPNDWDTAANWSLGVAPVDADDVIIENSASSILYSLDNAAIELNSLTIKSTFTGLIGLPLWSAGGYTEHRTRYLTLSATTTTIDGSGSARINIDFDTDVISSVIVNGSGTSTESVPPILLKGGHATNTLVLNKGNVGVAYHAGETAALATIAMEYISVQASDAVLACGSGCTLTTLTKNGGTASTEANITTVTQTSGSFSICCAATITTLNLRGGTGYYKSSGTATTINVGPASVLDFRKDGNGRTVTTCNAYGGAAIYDPSATVTWTNDVALQQCSLTDVTLDLGTHYTWTPTPI